jgi:hypothetical protein
MLPGFDAAALISFEYVRSVRLSEEEGPPRQRPTPISSINPLQKENRRSAKCFKSDVSQGGERQTKLPSIVVAQELGTPLRRKVRSKCPGELCGALRW